MSRKRFIAAIGLIIATGAVLTAQSGTITRVLPPISGLRFAEPWRPVEVTGETRIIGTVIDIRQVPVAGVRVRLRNLATGVVVQEGETDGNGAYEFVIADPGTYVVEMVRPDGYVVALSNAGALARYETLQTVVTLPGRWDSQASDLIIPQNVADFAGMSAATSMTAQTLTLAAAQRVSPANAGEPVSP